MSTWTAGGRQVAIVGYAHSDIVRNADQTLGELAGQTARQAIADAGLTVDQIDGFVGSALFPTSGSHEIEDGVSTVSPAWLAQHLGAMPRYTEGFTGMGQLPGSVGLAVHAITTGEADYVLMHRALHNPPGRYHGNTMDRVSGMQQWTAPQGYFGPLAMIALPTNEYLQRFGARRESLAEIAVEARKNGSQIPWSFWHDRPLTTEDYLESPTLFDPICRFDCDIPVDGVATFVFTSAERAKDLPNQPVYVAGFGMGAPTRPRLPLHRPLDDIMDGGRETATRLWADAGIGPADIDLPQVYDGFSPFVWFWLEALGLCPPGEAHRFIADGGIDSDRPGSLPALSSGGAIGNGRMHGVPQMLECYLQLAGRAGDRQRQAEVAVACHASPHLGGVVAYSSQQLGKSIVL
jgi:acetyl-CoA acetyltransferase